LWRPWWVRHPARVDRTLVLVTRPAAAPTAKGRARREQLLATALRAFGVNGYRGTSLAVIVGEAGISEAGLLHYFPSKPTLLLATLEHYEVAVGEAARRATASNSSHADLLLRLAADHERDPQFIRLLLVVGSESTDPEHPGHEWVAQRYERTRQRAERQFAADQGANLLRPEVDTAQLAALMVAVMDGLELQFLLSGGTQKIVAPLRAFFAPYYR
jgi:AcrR family transcriptional regulator